MLQRYGQMHLHTETTHTGSVLLHQSTLHELKTIAYQMCLRQDQSMSACHGSGMLGGHIAYSEALLQA